VLEPDVSVSNTTMAEEEAPHFCRNKWISKGSQIVHSTPWECLDNLSLRTITHETMNVYSTMFGMVLMVLLLVNVTCAWESSSLPTNFPLAKFYVVVGVFMLNLVSTTAYHVFLTYAPWYKVMSAIDLFGINFALLSISLALFLFELPLVAVGFEWCRVKDEYRWDGGLSWVAQPEVKGLPLLYQYDPNAEPDYLSARYMPYHLLHGAILAAALIVFAIRVSPWVTKEAPLPLIMLNVGIPAVVSFPLYVHHMLEANGGVLRPRTGLAVALLLLGLATYLGKYPERCSTTGRFDRFFHSHSLWHCLYIFSFYFIFTDFFVFLSGKEDALWDTALLNPFIG
jgi:predicted membrane channel-forming protein YqfA (hemolysin III family)